MGLSTISAHGRALKLELPQWIMKAYRLSTISAHGRALKPYSVEAARRRLTSTFNNFGSR